MTSNYDWYLSDGDGNTLYIGEDLNKSFDEFSEEFIILAKANGKALDGNRSSSIKRKIKGITNAVFEGRYGKVSKGDLFGDLEFTIITIENSWTSKDRQKTIEESDYTKVYTLAPIERI